jgi:hypothetical protein
MPTPVQLSCFLNLSAVSQQTQASRPYFVPQPFVSLLLQSIPLTEIASPSRGHVAPLQFSTSGEDRTSRGLVTSSFTDSQASRPSRLDPLPAMGSLSTDKPSPGRPRPRAIESPFPPASPAPKPYSLCESVHNRHEFPRAEGRYSLGFSPL